MTRIIWLTGLCLLTIHGQGRFPKPAPAQAFSELKVRDAQGSPLRVPREDWTQARKLMQDEAAWAAWLQTRKAATTSGWRSGRIAWNGWPDGGTIS